MIKIKSSLHFIVDLCLDSCCCFLYCVSVLYEVNVVEAWYKQKVKRLGRVYLLLCPHAMQLGKRDDQLAASY